MSPGQEFKSDPAFAHPRSIGEFSVVHLIGQGGMGRVYECVDDKLERHVAIKVLRHELRTQPVLVERFLREARAMAKISSPHVVTVHQVGEDRGLPFLVMELLEGEDLAARLKREGPLDAPLVLRFLQDAVCGLRAASEAGIIHRDIKPANLFVVNERIKVTDFGLARPRQIDVKLTHEGWIVGTPHYLAPESAQGVVHNEISDIYALGVSAFEMLTGRTPYVGQVALEILNAHIHKPIPRTQKYRPEVPDDVEGLVLRMMAKEATDRFPNYGSLQKTILETLERYNDISPGTNSNDQNQFGKSWLFCKTKGLQAFHRLQTLRFRFSKKVRRSLVVFVCVFSIGMSLYIFQRRTANDEENRAKIKAELELSHGQSIAPGERSPRQELKIGDAHRVLDEPELALLAYGRALRGGLTNDDALEFALGGLDNDASEAAVDYLVLWPHPLRERLANHLQMSWWPRHNALRILEQREEADDDMRRKVGLKDLIDGETCGRRRFGLLILRRTSDRLSLLEPVRYAYQKMPENQCMQKELRRFLRELES